MNTPSSVSVQPVVVVSVSVSPPLEVLLPPLLLEELLPPLDPPPLLPPPPELVLPPGGGPPESVEWSVSASLESVGRAQPTSNVRSGSTLPGAGRPRMVQSLY
jgi:hypothetical protein